MTLLLRLVWRTWRAWQAMRARRDELYVSSRWLDVHIRQDRHQEW